MATPDRRAIIQGLAAVGASTALPSRAVSDAPSNGAASAPELRGHVHGLGIDPRLFPTFESGKGKAASVLSSIELATGAVKQTVLDMSGGHMTVALDNGAILCVAHHQPKSLVVDRQHRVIGQLETGTEYLFGGHGWVDSARGRFVLPQRRRHAKGAADVGSLLIYDINTFKLLDTIPSGGIHPHELHPIPGTDEVAVTHYGDIATRHAIFEHNVIDAKLSILDARTLKPKRHYPQDVFKAMVTHMRVDQRGWAHLVLTQYISWPGRTSANAYATAVADLERSIGRKIDFPIPQAALEERLLPLPLPMLAVHTQTGERRVIHAGDRHHLRSQSIAYSAAADTAIAVFSHSDNLIIERQNRAAAVVPAARLGLRDIRGVVDVAGTTLVVVTGSYRNVAIYDLATDAVVARFETSNYRNIHLSHDA